MAIGPLGRIIAQVVVPVIAVLARALPAAYSAAVQNAKKSGVAKETAKNPFATARMARDEALQILNLTEAEATPEAIQKQYQKYFEANAVNKGGSFYLQSKVYRAKEMLDEFEKEKRMELKEEKAKQEKKQQQ